MGNQITIRPIEETDKEWMKPIMVAAWGSEIVVASKPFNTLKIPGFIAELDGKPAGVMTYDVDKDKLELVSLNSTIEGKGVGSALIEESKKLAKEKGLKSVWLVTSNDNVDALKFYQRRGFRITKVHPDAIDEARKLKPNIPEFGEYGIPLKDALELEWKIAYNVV